MKKVITIMACACALVAFALEADYHENERSTDLLPTNAPAILETMLGTEKGRAMIHALRLQMGKYDNDMRTEEGRRAWHGNRIGEIIDTNTLQKVTIYSNTVNGAIWKYREAFKMQPVRKPMTQSERDKELARLRSLPTNGVPERVLAARQRRIAALEQGTVITTIVSSPPMPATGGAE